MRVLVLIAVLLGCVTSAGAQTPGQFSEGAKRAAADLQRVITDTREGPPGKFYKVTYRLDGATWDVKKTDSMLNPVQAVVKAEIVSAASTPFATREDAERADTQTVGSTKLELTYVPSVTGWKFLEGRLYADPLRTWLPVEYGKCSEKKAFICSVVEAFSVKK